jgi:hypothetical protein
MPGAVLEVTGVEEKKTFLEQLVETEGNCGSMIVRF